MLSTSWGSKVRVLYRPLGFFSVTLADATSCVPSCRGGKSRPIQASHRSAPKALRVAGLESVGSMAYPKKLDQELRGRIEMELARGKLSQREIAKLLAVSRWQVDQVAKIVALPRRRKIRRLRKRNVAYVEVGGRRHYLGPWPKRGDQATHERYQAALEQLEREHAERCQTARDAVQEVADALAAATSPRTESTENPAPIAAAVPLTVAAYLERFLDWAEGRYRDADGEPSAHLSNLAKSIDRLRGVTQGMLLADLGPKQLAEVRRVMIGEKLARSYINATTRHLKQIVAWGRSFDDETGEERDLIPELLAFRISKFPLLQAGKSLAKELPDVEPVPDQIVAATLPFLSDVVAGMVLVQRLTGMRSANLCELRRAEIDMSGPVWLYTPRRHKTAYLGKKLRIAIGAEGQAILREMFRQVACRRRPTEIVRFPRDVEPSPTPAPAPTAPATLRFPAGGDELRPVTAYVFDPRESHAWHFERRRKQGNRKKRKVSSPKRSPGDRYDPHAYARAVRRAIGKANQARLAELRQRLGRAPTDDESIEVLLPTWHVHQLRHAFATEVERRFGVEAAAVALGHSSPRTTRIYAKPNPELAARVAAELG